MEASEKTQELLQQFAQDERVIVVLNECVLNVLKNSIENASKLTHAILVKARENNYKNAIGWGIFWQAWISFNKSNFDDTLTSFHEAEKIFIDTDDSEGRVRIFNGKAVAYTVLGKYDLAFDCVMKALDLADALGKARLISSTLVTLGDLYIRQRHYDEALQSLFQALNQDHTNRVEVFAKVRLGQLRVLKGDFAGALPLLDEAQALAEGEEFKNLLSDALALKGEALHGIGWVDEAEKCFIDALEIAQEMGERYNLAKFNLNYARLELSLGLTVRAQNKLSYALTVAEEIKATTVVADVHLEIASVKENAGHYREALMHYKQYHHLFDALFIEKTERYLSHIRREQNKRDAKAYKSLYDQVSTISAIGKELTSCLDLDTALMTAYERMHASMECDAFGIALYNPENQMLEYKLLMERGERIHNMAFAVNTENSFGAYCFNKRSEIFISNIDAEAALYIDSVTRSDEDKEKEQSLLFCPLVAGGSITGILTVQSVKRHAYTRHNLEYLKALASYIAIAIENAQQVSALSKMATQDPLTKINNRRSLFEIGTKEFLQTKRYGRSLSVFMVDIDHFKKVNDAYGHNVGDQVLRHVADKIKACLRETDTVGRYGGEEFVVVLPETNEEGACALAERIRRELGAEPAASVNDKAIKITASFGVFSFRPDTLDFESGVIAADRALYDAKNSGRNRVRVFKPE